MKEKLDAENRAAIVSYRLERAYETLKEADYNTEGGYYNAAVNRLYYACYYAASALLLKCEIDANTHCLRSVRRVIIVILHIVILLW